MSLLYWAADLYVKFVNRAFADANEEVAVDGPPATPATPERHGGEATATSSERKRRLPTSFHDDDNYNDEDSSDDRGSKKKGVRDIRGEIRYVSTREATKMFESRGALQYWPRIASDNQIRTIFRSDLFEKSSLRQNLNEISESSDSTSFLSAMYNKQGHNSSVITSRLQSSFNLIEGFTVFGKDKTLEALVRLDFSEQTGVSILEFREKGAVTPLSLLYGVHRAEDLPLTTEGRAALSDALTNFEQTATIFWDPSFEGSVTAFAAALRGNDFKQYGDIYLRHIIQSILQAFSRIIGHEGRQSGNDTESDVPNSPQESARVLKALFADTLSGREKMLQQYPHSFFRQSKLKELDALNKSTAAPVTVQAPNNVPPANQWSALPAATVSFCTRHILRRLGFVNGGGKPQRGCRSGCPQPHIDPGQLQFAVVEAEFNREADLARRTLILAEIRAKRSSFLP